MTRTYTWLSSGEYTSQHLLADRSEEEVLVSIVENDACGIDTIQMIVEDQARFRNGAFVCVSCAGEYRQRMVKGDSIYQKSGMQIREKTSPIRAPIRYPILTCCTENPVKPSFSVPVENTLKNRSVYQNKADLHLSQSPPRALEPRLFSSLITHMNPLNPARTPI